MDDEKPKQSIESAATSAPVALTPAEIRRDSSTFFSGYANNVTVESNTFDLRLVFGILDQRNPIKAAVDQFAGINVSWPEAKLLIFWMQVHVAGYEKENGKIKVPASALPLDVSSSMLPPQFNNPKGQESIELIRKMRAEFIAKQSES